MMPPGTPEDMYGLLVTVAIVVLIIIGALVYAAVTSQKSKDTDKTDPPQS